MTASLIGRRIRARLSEGEIIAYDEPVEGIHPGTFHVRWDKPEKFMPPVTLVSTYEDYKILPGNDESVCVNCRFYSDDEECHRHAPLPSVGASVTDVGWPQVKETDWCGEFERAEP